MMNWRRPVFYLLFLCPWMLGVTECNTFSGAADKTSGEALMYTARQYIDAGDYDNALTTIALLTATVRGSHDGRVLEATAYAGKCGLNLVSLAKALADDLDTRKLMQILLTQMKTGTQTIYGHCTSATTLVQGISASDMTSDDYIFQAFIQFARIGSVLASLPGVDADDDGGADAGANAVICTAGFDVDTDNVGVALNIAMSSITSSGITVDASLQTAYTNACTAGFPCAITTVGGFNALQRLAIRTFIRAEEIGLNTCNGASTSCPCLAGPAS